MKKFLVTLFAFFSLAAHAENQALIRTSALGWRASYVGEAKLSGVNVFVALEHQEKQLTHVDDNEIVPLPFPMEESFYRLSFTEEDAERINFSLPLEKSVSMSAGKIMDIYSTRNAEYTFTIEQCFNVDTLTVHFTHVVNGITKDAGMFHLYAPRAD
jgi:hypothetical protein